MAKELHWHDTLALMDIELIHKHGKNNVVPYVLNRMEEYQWGMHWESIQILRAMFVEKSHIKRKIQKAYVEDVWHKVISMTCAKKRRWKGSPF